jgi:hypothetical protein
MNTMSTPYCSNSGPQALRTPKSLPNDTLPLAHEYGAWCRKTNFHCAVLFARSFCSQLVCVASQQLSVSMETKWASPESKE